MAKRYYFPNLTTTFDGYTIEVTSGGTVYQRQNRDKDGSMRRISAVWFGRNQRFKAELLDGRMIYLTVVKGKLEATAVEPPSDTQAPAT